MTKPERPDDLNLQGQTSGGQTSPGQTSSWIDDVLKAEPGAHASQGAPLSGPDDLKIPVASGPRPPAPPQASATYAARPSAPSTPVSHQSAYQTGPQTNAWGEPVAPSHIPSGPAGQPLYISPDVAQKRLIAGLLGIFLGSLGIHKFYLGITNPGIIMLAITLGTVFFGVMTLIFGIGFLILGIPSLVGLLGFVEGIIYLTKSDADFQREYIDGKKPWL